MRDVIKKTRASPLTIGDLASLTNLALEFSDWMNINVQNHHRIHFLIRITRSHTKQIRVTDFPEYDQTSETTILKLHDLTELLSALKSFEAGATSEIQRSINKSAPQHTQEYWGESLRQQIIRNPSAESYWMNKDPNDLREVHVWVERRRLVREQVLPKWQQMIQEWNEWICTRRDV